MEIITKDNKVNEVIVPIKKAVDELQIVYGEVYVPNRVDTDGEAMSVDDVRKMAHEFLATGKVFNIDIQHDMEKSGCQVVESFIAREGDEDYVVDAWVMGVWCPDDIWKQVQSGDLNGFSFGGTTKKHPAKVLVEVAKQIAGLTEESTDGPLPPHEHTFIVNVNNDGQIVSGKTDTVMEHMHLVLHGTATEDELDHVHRVVLE